MKGLQLMLRLMLQLAKNPKVTPDKPSRAA